MDLSPVPSLAKPTKHELYKMGLVYEAIAKLLPTEGRDFKTEIQFHGDQLSVRLTGLTPLGQTFADHCQEHLTAALSEVADDHTGATQREIRAAIANSGSAVRRQPERGTGEEDSSEREADSPGESAAVDRTEHVL